MILVCCMPQFMQASSDLFDLDGRIELPCFTQEILEKRFSSLGVTDLIEKTDIIHRLLDVKDPREVAAAVEPSYAEYYTLMQKEMAAPVFRVTQIQMEVYKILMYESLLQEYPSVLAELEQRGIYKPGRVRHCA